MTVRLGLVAAARIAESAIIAPAPQVEGVEIAGVAARSAERAQAAAEGWNIPRWFGSYEDLLATDDIDAVYIGTPAALHRPWTLAALQAGKHVLCEKPLAANADDAQKIADAAGSGDLVVMEAFHWRYHPLAAQIGAVLDAGQLGTIERVEARFDLKEGTIPKDDIRWDLALGGGAMMDVGCYPVSWVRFAANEEPDVTSATAECPVDQVDGSLSAELTWPSGATGSIHASMVAPARAISLHVVGTEGSLMVTNPLAPQDGSTMVLDAHGEREEFPVSNSSTYFHQLRAFRDAVTEGNEFPTTAADGVRTMAVIDACYRAADLEPRPTLPGS